MPSARASVISLTLLAGATLLGCDRQEPIALYQAPKDTTPVVTSAVGPAVVEAPPRPAASELTWTVPAGWKQEPAGGQMRFASFLVHENPKVELTIVPLGPEAGDLLPNINRWEKQLHLPPSPAEKLAEIAKPEVINGLQATLVDLTGPAASAPRERMLAAIVPHAGRVWFFKLVGPVDLVSPQVENFHAFMHSLQPGAAAPQPPMQADMTADAPPSSPGAEAAVADPQPGSAADSSAPVARPAGQPNLKLARWTAPPDWQEEPNPTGPRAVAFQMGSADKKAEFIVTHFHSGNAGDFLSNINRWRSQIGLEAAADPNAITRDLKNVQVGKDGEGFALELSNPAASKSMVVTIGSIGGELWFYKLTGDSKTVAAQRPAYDAFLKSVQFAPATP